MSAPVEVTTTYTTTVDEITDALAFVMAKLDLVGPAPAIAIDPIGVLSATSFDDDEWVTKFEVVVSGMVPEGGENS